MGKNATLKGIWKASENARPHRVCPSKRAQETAGTQLKRIPVQNDPSRFTLVTRIRSSRAGSLQGRRISLVNSPRGPRPGPEHATPSLNGHNSTTEATGSQTVYTVSLGPQGMVSVAKGLELKSVEWDSRGATHTAYLEDLTLDIINFANEYKYLKA